MKIRINGMKFGKRSLLNDMSLENYELDEVQSMIASAVGISIFLKDQTREAEAIELVKGLVPDFKGELYSKATEHGWVERLPAIGSLLNPCTKKALNIKQSL